MKLLLKSGAAAVVNEINAVCVDANFLDSLTWLSFQSIPITCSHLITDSRLCIVWLTFSWPHIVCLPSIRALLSVNKYNINQRSFRLMCRTGAASSVDAPSPVQRGDTPLHIAGRNDCKIICDYLLEEKPHMLAVNNVISAICLSMGATTAQCLLSIVVVGCVAVVACFLLMIVLMMFLIATSRRLGRLHFMPRTKVSLCLLRS